MKNLAVKFSIGDIVNIDNDIHIKAVVIGILIRKYQTILELAWLHNGTHQSAFIDDFRITGAK